MHVTHLRKVGGSVMLVVPPALLDMLDLHPGAMVSLAVEGGRFDRRTANLSALHADGIACPMRSVSRADGRGSRMARLPADRQ